MSSEVASMLNHALVLEPSQQDVLPCLKPISDRSLTTESSESLSDLEDCHTSTELGIKNKGPSSLAVKRPSKVRWGNVDVRIFPIIPGDHPDCLRGPPLTIAWDHVQEISVPVDEFEEERKYDRNESDQLIICWLDRRYKLKSLGFEDSELKHASEQSRKLRRHREWTVSRLAKNDRFELLQESLVRKIGRGFRPKKNLVTKY